MRASKKHQELTDGVGCCSVPMWQMGMECFCEKPAYGEQEKGQRRYGEYAWDGRWIPGYCGGLACYNHGGPQKPEPAPALDPPTPEFAPDVTLEDAAGRDVGVQPFFDLPNQQQDLAPEIQQLISANMDALVEKPAQRLIQKGDYAKLVAATQPAPATDVDALLAEAEMLLAWSCSDVKDNPGAVLQTVSILATALRESRAREVALEADGEMWRMRLAGCSVAALGNTPESVSNRIGKENPYYSASYGDVCAAVDREIALRTERDAAIARAERAEAELADANASLALCAENTAAAELAQEVEFLKAELAGLGALKGGKEVPFSALAYGTPMSSLVERKPAQ